MVLGKTFSLGMLIVPGAGLCPRGGRRSPQYFYLHMSCKGEKMKIGKEREGRGKCHEK